MSRGSRALKVLLPLGILVVTFLAALWILHRELHRITYHDLVRALRTIPVSRIGWAAGATVLSYSLLSLYDFLALAHIGRRLPARRVLFTAFTSYVVSHNVGFAGLGGSAVRARLYSLAGLTAVEIGQVILFCGLTFWLGMLGVGAVALTLAPPALPDGHPLHLSLHAIGIASAAVVVGYFTLAMVQPPALQVRSWRIALPSRRNTLAQTLLAPADWAASAAVLYVLLPEGSAVSFLPFLGVYVAAVVVGFVSHVPGGLGIFEGMVLVLLRGTAPPEQLLGALVAYRAVYYLAPMVLGLLLLAGFELATQLRKLRPRAAAALPLARLVVPRLAYLGAMGCGAVLLLSGATPGAPDRLRGLRELVPIGLLELSHLAGSLVGVALLVLARGLLRCVDAAWWATLVALALGCAASLGKGFDWEEASVLAFFFVVLVSSRGVFTRRSTLLRQPLQRDWCIALFVVIAGSLWLGLFSYKHVEYSQELWWRFTLHGDASRFLRASLGSVVFLVTLGGLRLLRPAPPRPELPNAADLADAERIARAAPDVRGWLALTGDKSLLFSPDRRSFLMYSVVGDHWITMGDPVGDPSQFRDLVWTLRDRAEFHGDGCAHYQVRESNLALYVEIGATLLKYGEEAFVDLEHFFDASGGGHRSLRRNVRRLEEEGVRFEVLAPPHSDELLAELRGVSDEWLADKESTEKGFSVGSFSVPYLQLCRIAVVRENERIVAFANLWECPDPRMLSLDLMRHRQDAPKGGMDYLFTRLILWGKEEGYATLDLGAAPLSGLPVRPGVKLWNRLGNLVYEHAGALYHFEGLRQYKEKFDPRWSPIYVAAPRALSMPRVMLAITQLVSGRSRARPNRTDDQGTAAEGAREPDPRRATRTPNA